MANALEQRSQYIRDFATHMSHEFKTPLTSIRGSAELVSEHYADMSDEERARFLGNIQADTARLKALVNRLMDLAKSDNVLPMDETTDLGVALEDIASHYREASVSLLNEQPIETRLSAENLGIIASNLIENALAAGASKVKSRVSGTSDNHDIIFRDNGPGISSGNRDKIFDAFFTTKREIGGTGLGPGIVRSLVEAHGGRIMLGKTTDGAGFKLSF